MTTTPTAAALVERFESVEEVRAAHNELLKDLPEPPGPGTFGLVTEFIDRAVATGAVLDTPEDRKQVQGLIDYWAASLATASRHAAEDGTTNRIKPATTVLAQLDPGTIRAVAAAADAWLKRSGANQDLVRRVMLRLVRLLADGVNFDPVPAVRATMYDLDTPERVDAVVNDLAAAGVVRVTKAESPELDRIALRSPELTTEWGAYKGWLAERRRFRDAVREWGSAGQPDKALATGDQLEEARSYFDRDGLEREFLEQSKRREWRENEKNRVLKWVFLAVASVAIVATVAAVWGWISARNGWAQADLEGKRATTEEHNRFKLEQAEREAIELDTAANSAATLAISSLLMSEDPIAVHAAKKVLIIQTLRNVLFARSKTAAEASALNWKRLQAQLTEKGPDLGNRKWFRKFLRETHQKAIERITSHWPADRRSIDDLRKITLDLREYIVIDETEEALNIIRPVVLYEAVRVAERIKDAAKTRKALSEVEPYRVAFWRLSSSLIIVADDDDQKEDLQKEFTDALQKWEDAGEVASPEIVKALTSGLNRLLSERDRVRPR